MRKQVIYIILVCCLCSCSPRVTASKVYVPKSKDAIDQFGKREHKLFKVSGLLFFLMVASYMETTR